MGCLTYTPNKHMHLSRQPRTSVYEHRMPTFQKTVEMAVMSLISTTFPTFLMLYQVIVLSTV